MPRDPTEPSIVSAIGLQNETDSRASLVREDKRFITETFGPMTLASGEVFDIINTKEKGELVYIKVVTDNPYAAVLLELDDFRNREPNGETSAELIYDGRTTKSDNQFFAVDGDPATGYALVYNPMRPEPYDYKIRVQLSNLIPKSSDPFGNNLSSVGRQGLPSPAAPIHIGGGSFTFPGLGAADLDTIAKAVAKPVGAQPYRAPDVYNPAIFNQDNITVGAHTPYQGLAARPVFRRDDSAVLNDPTQERGATVIDGQTLSAAENGQAAAISGVFDPGVKVLFGEQSSGGSNPRNFPGTPGTPSSMTISLTDISEEDGAVVTGFAVGDRVFIRDGDTLHFPGVITNVAALNGGTNNRITVQPGLLDIPEKLQVETNSENKTIGTVVTEAELTPKIFVKQIIIKRRKLVSFEG